MTIKEQEQHNYLTTLEDLALACDMHGYRKVCQDLKHYHPEFWEMFRQAVLAESTIRPIAVLLRRKDNDQMT